MSGIRTYFYATLTDMNQLTPTPPPATGSLNRASILLTAIARGSRKGSLLTEIVARTSLPRPTIHRTMDMLIKMGWVERDSATRRYNLGHALAVLGYSAINRHRLEAIAAPVLSALAVQLKHVVYLQVRDGLDTVCIGRYESGIVNPDEKGQVGFRGPLGMSPSCTAMFAYLPATEIEHIIKANLSRYHRIEGFDETGFRNVVKDALEKGYGTYDNIILNRILSAFAVAIRDESGYPIAAVAMTYEHEKSTAAERSTFLATLKNATLQIQEEITKAKLNDH